MTREERQELTFAAVCRMPWATPTLTAYLRLVLRRPTLTCEEVKALTMEYNAEVGSRVGS